MSSVKKPSCITITSLVCVYDKIVLIDPISSQCYCNLEKQYLSLEDDTKNT